MNKKLIGFLTLIGTVLAGCGSIGGPSIHVEKEKIYELGDTVSIAPKDLITDQLTETELGEVETVSDLKTSSKYDFNGFKEEVKTAGKDYLEVGNYEVTLSYKGRKYPVSIIVEDTTAPSFMFAPANRVVAKGASEDDVLKGYRATDKDSVKLKLTGDYDLNTPGTYNAVVVAEDPSGNKSEKSITIQVTGDGEMITSDQTVDYDEDNTAAEEEEAASDAQNPSEPAAQPSDSSSPDSSQTGNDDHASSSTSPDSGTTDSSAPADQPSSNPGACPATGAPAGSTIYRSFDEAYAAGVAWNQQSPDNYFYYLQGVDDCGNQIYIITMGTKGADDGF